MDILALISDPAIWASLLTLTALEIVLGVDNLVIIAILSSHLPRAQQPLARRLGLGAALITRIMLLSLAFFIAQLSKPLFNISNHAVSVRDILLLIGGIFLLVKGTAEIRAVINAADHTHEKPKKQFSSFGLVIAQIAVMDIVFSFDSVMTAIGIADQLAVMILAIILSMIVMVAAVEGISHFINRYPTVKMLALSYVVLIGVALGAEGLQIHIPKGYLYSAMIFSLFVEALNQAARRRK